MEIIDNTLRDGSYVVDFKISEIETYKVVKSLESAGVRIIEIGHGLGLGAYRIKKYKSYNDELIINAAIKARNKAKLSVFFIPGIGKKDDIIRAKDLGIDIIRIGTNINEYKKSLEFIEFSKKIGLKVAFNGMKSYAVKAHEFSLIANDIHNWQLVDIIYLVDSAGCMMPNEVSNYIEKTITKISTPIGFHGHNNLSLANINSIYAINSGASFVDSCLYGMGRSAGNAQTEILVILLNKLGLCNNIDIYKLYKISEELIPTITKKTQGISPNEIHVGFSKFHSSYEEIAFKFSKKYKIPFKRLIKNVSDINCLNPKEELFDLISKKIKNEKS